MVGGGRGNGGRGGSGTPPFPFKGKIVVAIISFYDRVRPRKNDTYFVPASSNGRIAVFRFEDLWFEGLWVKLQTLFSFIAQGTPPCYAPQCNVT